MAITQKQRIFEITTPLGEDVLVFHRMTGAEQLGRLFEYEIELLSEHPDIELAELLGKNVTVCVALPEASGGNSAARESGLSARETRARVDSTEEDRRSSRETRGGGGAGGTRYFNGFVTRFSYLQKQA